MRVYTAETNKLKDITLQKNTPKFCNFKLEHRNISKYPFSYFPRCRIHTRRNTHHSHFWPTIKFYKQHFLPTSSSLFLYNLFANLKIIFFCQSKQPIYTSFSNSLEYLIKLILVQIRKNTRQHSRTFFQITFSSKKFLEASL